MPGADARRHVGGRQQFREAGNTALFQALDLPDEDGGGDERVAERAVPPQEADAEAGGDGVERMIGLGWIDEGRDQQGVEDRLLEAQAAGGGALLQELQVEGGIVGDADQPAFEVLDRFAVGVALTAFISASWTTSSPAIADPAEKGWSPPWMSSFGASFNGNFHGSNEETQARQSRGAGRAHGERRAAST